jgi:hypothetical protein
MKLEHFNILRLAPSLIRLGDRLEGALAALAQQNFTADIAHLSLISDTMAEIEFSGFSYIEADYEDQHTIHVILCDISKEPTILTGGLSSWPPTPYGKRKTAKNVTMAINRITGTVMLFTGPPAWRSAVLGSPTAQEVVCRINELR